MPSSDPTLLVDDREPPYLREIVVGEIPGATVQRLSIGDYVIHDACGHVMGIERKDISDLLHSMSDQRLRRQIPNISTMDHALLVIEGCWEMDESKNVTVVREDDNGRRRKRATKWKASSAQMILLGLQRANPTLTVLHTSSPLETVAVLKSLTTRALSGCVMESLAASKRA